ncbi:MAG TPA: hypothetical protein VNI84_07030 [Pyrinomonadaceae bacterium]|nr:hypothetical protein [Pyrinomonadaceae bacterium]
MKKNIEAKKICVYLCLSVVLTFIFASPTFSQTAPLLKRTTYKTEKIEFGAGGTLSIIGAPSGSITIEGWQKNEIEISAEVEVQAANETDLALLAQVNTFAVDEDFGHVRVESLGAYNKNYMKRAGKKFPKNLYNMPFRIDYRIKVPVFCDLEIDGGRGELNLSGVEGAIVIKVLESNAKLNLIGGTVIATFGGGTVDVTIPVRGWRGRNADIQLAKGNMNVYFAQNLNADVNATVLRTGQIENSYTLLKPRARAKFTEKLITAKSGSGGAALSFTVGDGALKLAAIENMENKE